MASRTTLESRESHCAGAEDLARLAREALESPADPDYGKELLRKAEDKLTASHELITMAGEVVKNLGDTGRAERLYRKALDQSDEFGALTKLVEASAGLNDKDLSRAVVWKAADYAKSTPELLQVTDSVVGLLGDKAFASRLASAAEERVTRVDEMRRVKDAVDRHFSDDAERLARVREKLEKREANQARYAEFQQKEKELSTFRQHLNLAQRVMTVLEDPYYAAKLLGAAEQRLGADAYNFDNYRLLILTIDRYLEDGRWTRRLMDFCAEHSDHFSWLRELCRMAAQEMKDKDAGRNAAGSYYQGRVQQLERRQAIAPEDYTKLATAVEEDLGDREWASRLLESAASRCKDHFDYAHVGNLRRGLGDDERAAALFETAARSCRPGGHAQQLVRRLRSYGLDVERQKSLYRLAGEGVQEPEEGLRWVEGTVDLFKDYPWAREAYAELQGRLESDAQRARFAASKEFRPGQRFY